MVLEAKVMEFNRKYFLNTLNIESVSVKPRQFSQAPNRTCSAYYDGDCNSGNIVFIKEWFDSASDGAIHYVLFHEMAHQLDLDSDHGPHFQMLMKQYNGNATEQDTLEFAQTLKLNIIRKAENEKLFNRGMLPVEAQDALRKLEVAKKKDGIKDIFRILTGMAAFIGLFGGLLLIALLLIFGLDNPKNWLWIIAVTTISAFYFKLADY